MSLSDLASLAIIVQGAFFVVSIILVWYQLRENTKLVRTSNTQKLAELSSPFLLELAKSREMSKLWRQGTEDIGVLDDVDRERYFNLLVWYLIMHENIYHQWSKHLIDSDTYVSWTRDLEFYVQRQRVEQYWDRLSEFFEASFAAHVADIILRQSKEQRNVESR
jgi:hypothetical protein